MVRKGQVSVPGQVSLAAGKVTKISPLGVENDKVTTFELRVSIYTPGGEHNANLSENAEIIREEKKEVLLVPESALIYDKDKKTFLEVPDAKHEGGRRRVPATFGITSQSGRSHSAPPRLAINL